jgi:uncharacterized membrane protein
MSNQNGRLVYRRMLVLASLLTLLLSGCGPMLQVQVQQAGTDPAASTTAPSEQAGASEGTTWQVAEECTYATNAECATEDLLRTIVTYLTFFAELCGALVIGVATLRGVIRYIPHIFGKQQAEDQYPESIRLQLGKSLALALEFELGADILKTAVAPTLAVIAQLAAIAILRTFLNYFLEQEIRQAERRRARGQGEFAPSAPVNGADRRQES